MSIQSHISAMRSASITKKEIRSIFNSFLYVDSVNIDATVAGLFRGINFGAATTPITLSGDFTTGISIAADGDTAYEVTSAFTGTTMVLLAGTATNGISITGACTTAIDITGAFTTGISVAADGTTGIEVTSAFSGVTGFLMAGTATNGISVTGTCATAAINIGGTQTAAGLNISAVVTNAISITTTGSQAIDGTCLKIGTSALPITSSTDNAGPVKVYGNTTGTTGWFVGGLFESRLDATGYQSIYTLRGQVDVKTGISASGDEDQYLVAIMARAKVTGTVDNDSLTVAGVMTQLQAGGTWTHVENAASLWVDNQLNVNPGTGEVSMILITQNNSVSTAVIDQVFKIQGGGGTQTYFEYLFNIIRCTTGSFVSTHSQTLKCVVDGSDRYLVLSTAADCLTLGDCTVGVNLTGAMTDGIIISGATTDNGIEITGVAQGAGILIDYTIPTATSYALHVDMDTALAAGDVEGVVIALTNSASGINNFRAFTVDLTMGANCAGPYAGYFRVDIDDATVTGLSAALGMELILSSVSGVNGEVHGMTIDIALPDATSSPGSSSNKHSFIKMETWGNQTGEDAWDDNANILFLNGMTSGAGNIISANEQTLRINIEGTSRYLVVSGAEDSLSLTTTATPIVLAAGGAMTTGIGITGILANATARAIQSAVTVNIPAQGDGYGVNEFDLTITGQAASHVAALSSWVNIVTGIVKTTSYTCAQTNGIYEATGGTITDGKLIFGMRMTAALDEADYDRLCPFSINSNQTITALYDVGVVGPGIGVTIGSGTTHTKYGDLAFFVDSNGNVKYVRLYETPGS